MPSPRTPHLSLNSFLKCSLAVASLAYCSLAVAAFEANEDGVYVIEAEDLNLASCEIQASDSASGGSNVKLLDADSIGNTRLELPKGQYTVNAYFQSETEHGDGFYIAVDGKVKRTNTQVGDHGKMGYGLKFLIFETNGQQPVTLTFASAWDGHPSVEHGMVIDRFEITEFCASAPTLERWIK